MTEGEPKKVEPKRPWIKESEVEVPFAPPGTNTFGLKVRRITYVRGEGETSQRKEYWNYDLDDNAQVIGLTPEGQMIVIQEQRPGIDKPYPAAVGETIEENEPSLLAAVRGMLEETGYCPKPLAGSNLVEVILDKEKRGNAPALAEELEKLLGDNAVLLSKILENTGRSDKLIHHWLLRNCVKVRDGEKDIKLTTMSVEEFRKRLAAYHLSNPKMPHAGGNSSNTATLVEAYLSSQK